MMSLSLKKPLRAVGALALLTAVSGCAVPVAGTGQPVYGGPVAQPPAGPSVIVAGQARAADGTLGRYPQGSRMVVRVYDAGVTVNRPLVERTFTRGTGSLPWAYEVRVPDAAFRSLQRPAVAARVEAPDGVVIYKNVDAVLMRAGAADDIPMVRQVAPGRYSVYGG